MRVLVTRPSRDAETTAKRLLARGHEAVIAPVMEIVATNAEPPRAPFDALVATSAHAIELASRDVLRRHVATPLWCVGARTTVAARARGFSNVKEPAPNARELATRMLARAKPHGRYLYLAGLDRKPMLEDALRAANHHVDVLIVYEARAATALPPAAIEALGANRIDAVLHLSRRSAELFLTLAREAGVDQTVTRAKHVCISEDAARPLRDAHLEPRVAATPDFAGLLAALENPAVDPSTPVG